MGDIIDNIKAASNGTPYSGYRNILDNAPTVEAISKEKQIQDYENKMLIDELSKMPSMVIATAYLYAINYTLYGEDVTEKWLTATQNASALEKAYEKGYYDALQRQAESEEK